MVLSDIVERMRGEGLDVPGLRLTGTHARRLWNLDRRACQQLLHRLVEDRLVSRPDEGVQGSDPVKSRV